VKEHTSGEEKVMVGLPYELSSIIEIFRLLIQPTLRQMMGSTAVRHKIIRAVLGEDVRLNADHPEYRFVYMHKDSRGAHVVRSNGILQNRNLSQALLFLPKADTVSMFLAGTVVEVLLFGQLNSSHLFNQIGNSQVPSNDSIMKKEKKKIVSVGVITFRESSQKKVTEVISMIKKLFSQEVECSMKTTSTVTPQLLQIMQDWTYGANTKQVIFTIGGVGLKDKLHVCKVTQQLARRELHKIVEKMFDGYKAEEKDVFVYRGTVGICNKSLIVNLPEKESAAKHCLKNLENYMDTTMIAFQQ